MFSLVLAFIFPCGTPLLHSSSGTGLSVSLLSSHQHERKARLTLFMDKSGALDDSLGREVSDTELESMIRGDSEIPSRVTPFALVLVLSSEDKPTIATLCNKLVLLKRIAVRQRPIHVFFRLPAR